MPHKLTKIKGIRPARQLQNLRTSGRTLNLKQFPKMRSTNFELKATFRHLTGNEVFSFKVRKSPASEEYTKIIFDLPRGQITVDRYVTLFPPDLGHLEEAELCQNNMLINTAGARAPSQRLVLRRQIRAFLSFFKEKTYKSESSSTTLSLKSLLTTGSLLPHGSTLVWTPQMAYRTTFREATTGLGM